MKTTFNYLIAFLFSLLLVSCAGTSTNPGSTSTATTPTSTTIIAPADNSGFVTATNAVCAALKIGGKLALAAQPDKTRVEYAKYLSGSGHLFASFSSGVVPTDDYVTNALAAYFPTTSGDYSSITKHIVAAVSGVRDVVKTYVPAKYTNYADYVDYAFAALAKTAYEVADPYLQ